MHKKQLRISVVIPTYNNQSDLPVLLASIKKQHYPADLVEILVCDGGSKDRTVKLSKSFGSKVYHNEKRLAEYGVTLGCTKATGDIITVLAADNELADTDYFSSISYPFLVDTKIMVSFPVQQSSAGDSWITRYINTFTDPINHFVYGNASNTRWFHREYPILVANDHFTVYNFSPVDYPMVALAQGTTIRRSWKRTQASTGDDILTIVEILSKGYRLAYVPKAVIFHHSTRTLGEFIKKQQWAFDNYLFGKNYGIVIRLHYFSLERKLRKLFWPFYAGSIVLPIMRSIVGYLRDRRIEWFYHPLLTSIAFLTLVGEYIRVKIMHQTYHRERK